MFSVLYGFSKDNIGVFYTPVTLNRSSVDFSASSACTTAKLAQVEVVHWTIGDAEPKKICSDLRENLPLQTVVFSRPRCAIDQFIKGLEKVHNLYSAMKSSAALRQLFLKKPEVLNAQAFRGLVEPKFSEDGIGNKRQLEESTVYSFEEMLTAIESEWC